MVPPSTHPSGEVLSWSGDGAPAKVSYASIGAAVRKVAAGTLLARHWPGEGGRNAVALALGGALLRAKMSEQAAIEFVELVAAAAGDEEAAERGYTVANTAEKLRSGEAATGFSTLKQALGSASVVLAFKWLQEAGEVEDSPPWESPILFEQMVPPDVPASLLPDPLGAFAKALSDVAETPEALAVLVTLGVVAVPPRADLWWSRFQGGSNI